MYRQQRNLTLEFMTLCCVIPMCLCVVTVLFFFPGIDFNIENVSSKSSEWRLLVGSSCSY